VTLATGRHVRAPRRYRGRDLFEWLDACGFLHEPRPTGVASVPSPPSLPLAGGPVPGVGEALGLHRLNRMGVRVTGRTLGVAGRTLHLAPTLPTEVAAGERRRQRLLAAIDDHIARSGDAAAPEPEAWDTPPPLPEAPERIDLAREGIRSVVWATGYRRSYRWLKLAALGPDGEILQSGGVTPIPGLFTLGLPFMRHRSSALIDGVGRDAEALLAPIARHLGHAIPLAA
jgi:putative flavoprotein involved in K+ transport